MSGSLLGQLMSQHLKNVQSSVVIVFLTSVFQFLSNCSTGVGTHLQPHFTEK